MDALKLAMDMIFLESKLALQDLKYKHSTSEIYGL